MSEISINTVENIDEIDQIILLTTFTTKLHRYYRVTLHFLDFHQQVFPQILSPPFYYLRESTYQVSSPFKVFNLLDMVNMSEKNTSRFMECTPPLSGAKEPPFTHLNNEKF